MATGNNPTLRSWWSFLLFSIAVLNENKAPACLIEFLLKFLENKDQDIPRRSVKLSSAIPEVRAPMRLTCPQELLLPCPAQTVPEQLEVNLFPGRDSRNVRLAKRHRCNDYIPLSLLHGHILACSALAHMWDEGFVMFLLSLLLPAKCSPMGAHEQSLWKSIQLAHWEAVLKTTLISAPTLSTLQTSLKHAWVQNANSCTNTWL